MAEFNGTPHNTAKVGDIAKTVLMPGDPLRAKFIAENFLENPKQFNNVRGMLGFTGTYKGVPVSVMGSGMGMPSIGIYSYELYSFYGVENIIRIGSSGYMTEDLDLFDVVLASGSYSKSSYAKVGFGYWEDIQLPSEKLNEAIEESAKKLGKKITKGLIESGDVFYSDETVNKPSRYELLCGEMESFGLFATARYCKKNAACLLTISDHMIKKTVTTAEERQNAFTDMMEIALNAAISL